MQAQSQAFEEKLLEFYDWGVRGRLDLIPTARKVHQDFAPVAGEDPDGPAILAALEGILREADRWGDRSVGKGPAKGRYYGTPPAGAKLTIEEVEAWASGIDETFAAVNQLGTYCHFRLKERRRSGLADRAAGGAALTAEQYQKLKRKNSLLNNLEILLGQSRLSSYPLRMELDPTNECNLRCRGCRHGITKDFHHIEMRREYVEILSEAFPYVDYLYPIGTGEPTMSSTLPLLIEEAARHDVKIDLLTNGTTLERAKLPWGSFFRLGISVDGASEETMRALRPVAPLAKVLSSLALLREKAPQATIYTKVTVSRMNYDELPALVERLGDVGVNEVIVHSLEVFHPVHEQIQVRVGDRQHMLECVEAARQTAERRGMTFQNSLNFAGAARPDDRARDKGEMFQVLKDNALPVLKIRELRAIREKFETAKFTYHPPSLEGMLKPAEQKGEGWRPEAVTVETIDAVLRDRAARVRKLTAAEAKVPYCFLPWKMPIVDPDGRARACCHLPGHVGDLDHGKTFQDLWSGPGFVELRESMFEIEKLPDVCAKCQEFDRSAYSKETLALADMLGVPIRQAPRHPVPMDLTRVLRAGKGKFEGHRAKEVQPGRWVVEPGGQILARFKNPRINAGVYYQGKFRISGGRMLTGVKPFWGEDLWQYMLEAEELSWLGDWVGLPMPPLTVDFARVSTPECCVFLWSPGDNGGPVTVEVRDFTGVATAQGPRYGDGLQLRHFWSGTTAANPRR